VGAVAGSRDLLGSAVVAGTGPVEHFLQGTPPWPMLTDVLTRASASRRDRPVRVGIGRPTKLLLRRITTNSRLRGEKGSQRLRAWCPTCRTPTSGSCQRCGGHRGRASPPVKVNRRRHGVPVVILTAVLTGQGDLADAGRALGLGLEPAAEPAGVVAHIDNLDDGDGPVQTEAALVEAGELAEAHAGAEQGDDVIRPAPRWR
jgi:hypothetical protein